MPHSVLYASPDRPPLPESFLPQIFDFFWPGPVGGCSRFINQFDHHPAPHVSKIALHVKGRFWLGCQADHVDPGVSGTTHLERVFPKLNTRWYVLKVYCDDGLVNIFFAGRCATQKICFLTHMLRFMEPLHSYRYFRVT